MKSGLASMDLPVNQIFNGPVRGYNAFIRLVISGPHSYGSLCLVLSSLHSRPTPHVL